MKEYEVELIIKTSIKSTSEEQAVHSVISRIENALLNDAFMNQNNDLYEKLDIEYISSESPSIKKDF